MSEGWNKAPKTQNAKRFDPVVVWRSTDMTTWGTPQEYQFPGDANEKPPAGFVAITFDSLRAIDKFTKDYNAVVKRQLDEEREYQRLFFEKRITDRRADALRRVWNDPKALALLKACQAYVDKRRELKYAVKIEPNFHVQPVAFDASNRQGFSSADTGWKDKKV